MNKKKIVVYRPFQSKILLGLFLDFADIDITVVPSHYCHYTFFHYLCESLLYGSRFFAEEMEFYVLYGENGFYAGFLLVGLEMQIFWVSVSVTTYKLIESFPRKTFVPYKILLKLELNSERTF
jgi:hypothetical protein